MALGAGPGSGGQTYMDQMFNLGGAAVTTLTAMNANTTSSAGGYTPLFNGHLLSVIIQITGQAASSLAQSGYITLSCTSFAPINTMTIPFAGFGLLTAPQLYGGTQATMVYPGLNLPIQSALQITGKVIYFFSPVTPNITVSGIFSTT